MGAERDRRIVATTIAFWFGLTATLRAEDPLPSMDVIRAEYLKSIRAVKSMDLRYRSTTIWKFETPEGAFDRTELKVVRDRERRVVENLFWMPGSEDWDTRTRWAFDGQQATMTWESRTVPKRRPLAHIGEIAESELSPNVASAWGEWLFSRQGKRDPITLESLLHDRNDLVRRWDRVNGDSCVVAQFPKEPLLPLSPERWLEITVWLDPQHGYLPKLSALKVVKLIDDEEVETSQIEHRVLEFTLVENGQPGRGFWFPTKGQVDNVNHSIQEYELIDARFNQPIDEQRFRIEVPNGADVKLVLSDKKLIRSGK